MIKLLRILGKRGRVTIPQEIRQRVGFGYNDVLSFAEQDDCTVILKREKICDSCRNGIQDMDNRNGSGNLLWLLDSLSPEEQRAALIHLSVLWANHAKTADENDKSSILD